MEDVRVIYEHFDIEGKRDSYANSPVEATTKVIRIRIKTTMLGFEFSIQQEREPATAEKEKT